MKICYITPGYPPNTRGGMEISLFLLTEALAKRGHKVSVFTPNYQGSDQVEEKNPKIYRLGWVSDSVFLRTNPISTRLFIKKILSFSTDFEIIDAYSWFQPAKILSKKLNIPFICSIRDSTPVCDFRIDNKPEVNSTADYFKKRFSYYGLLPRQIANAFYGYLLTQSNHSSLKGAACVFCASKALEKLVKPLNQCTKVINSIAQKDFKREKIKIDSVDFKKDKIVVYAGRLSSGKGVLFLYQVAEKLSQQNIKFVFIGEGELRREICTLVNQNIICLGRKDHDFVLNVISKAAVCVVPSLVFEAFPRLAIESISLGVPVIGTNVGGIPEAIGQAGIIIEPGNTEELTNAIRMLVDNKIEYQKYKNATEKEAKKYTETAICNKVFQGYKEVIDEFRDIS